VERGRLMKTIGIVGGAGPMASCSLYQTIIEMCQQRYGCAADADFPKIIIINYPFADMLSLEARESNAQCLAWQLQECIDNLVAQGAGVIAIACNTLHTLLGDIVLPPTCIVVHIAQATLQSVERQGLKRVLTLATSTTVGLGLYQSTVIDCLAPAPADQALVDVVISAVLAGELRDSDSLLLQEMVSRYQVDGVILGCTELPVLVQRFPLQIGSAVMIFDTVAILASVLLEESKK
jgi:aspartate racemase